MTPTTSTAAPTTSGSSTSAGGRTGKTWKTDGPIETGSGTAFTPKVVIDGSGNAMAVWIQRVTGTFSERIYANRYTPAEGWGTAQLIASSENGKALVPVLGVDSNGNVIAVWQDLIGETPGIIARRYTPASGWGTVQLIGTATIPVGLALDVDGSGNAMVVWYLNAGAGGRSEHIYANRYTPAGGWETEQLIEPLTGYTGTGYVTDARISVDGSGNAIAVWMQIDGPLANRTSRIFANSYTAASGWGTKQLFQTESDDAGIPIVDMDGNGNAIAMWVSTTGIYANRYVPASGWGNAQLIHAEAGRPIALNMAVDSNGNAHAVWIQHHQDGTTFSMYANRYTPSGGWGTVQPSASFSGLVFAFGIAVDGDGNATVVWSEESGNADTRIYANHLRASGWETTRLIASTNSKVFFLLGADVNSNGNAIAVWTQMEGAVGSIYASRFD
jgi:hypothetical protein